MNYTKEQIQKWNKDAENVFNELLTTFSSMTPEEQQNALKTSYKALYVIKEKILWDKNQQLRKKDEALDEKDRIIDNLKSGL